MRNLPFLDKIYCRFCVVILNFVIGIASGQFAPDLIFSCTYHIYLYYDSVIANNVNWGVSGSDGGSVINDLIDTANKNLSSVGISNSVSNSIPAINEGERMLKEKCLKISNSNESYNTILVSPLVRYTFLYYLFFCN